MMPADLVTPNQVSDFLLVECREIGELLTNLKLQKLLYYSQAWYLVQHNSEIFAEDFQAWVHGPVLPSQYHRFSSFAWRQIDSAVRKPDALHIKLRNHLKNIIHEFGALSAIQLELMTHQEAPWRYARKGLSATAKSTNKISKESMKAFYGSL